MAEPRYANLLLRLMGPAAVEALGPIEVVSLPMRHRLEVGGASRTVYFIESGVVSVIADHDGKIAVELGIVGREGMVGLGTIYDDDVDPFLSIVQVEGSAVAVEAARLAEVAAKMPEVQRILLHFARAFSIQVASTALANGRAKLDERLARWLMMVADRAGSHFAITHEFISIMLGVRRSGVTLALQILEGKGLIRATRGAVTILDRQGLKAAANSAYGFGELHYERLLGDTH